MSNNTFCDLKNFEETYKIIHWPLSAVVCIFGSVANILNICVLTTKEMRWPTNLILTGLAVADLLVMLEYIPFAYNRFDSSNISSFSYNWAVFMVFHALFSQIFHFISCSLTVILAIWRYGTITNPHNTRIWCSMKRTFYIILLTYIACPIICCPIFISMEIKEHNQTVNVAGKIINKEEVANYSGPMEKRSMYVTYYNNEYSILSLWIYGVVIKLVPCILLTYLSHRLIAVLLATKKRRKILLNSRLPLKDVNVEKPILNKKIDKNKQADRTSSMLVAVLLLFLITEFPQAILGLLSATKGGKFIEECYSPLGNVFDMLALTNSAINFILYCTMSRQFRSTFKEVFCFPKLFNNSTLLTQQSTGEKNEKTQLSQV